MKWLKSKKRLVALLVILLLVGVLVVRHMKPSGHALEVSEKIAGQLDDLCSRYAQFCERNATESEWQAFEQEARQQTAVMLADLQKRSSPREAGYWTLYHLAKSMAPRAIESRGGTPPTDLEQRLKQVREELSAASVAKRRWADMQQSAAGGVDWIAVGLVAFSLVLVGGLGYTFLKSKALRESKDAAPTTGGPSATVVRLAGGGFLVVVCAGLVLAALVWSPPLWGRCLRMLDVRNWTQWTWVGVSVALLAAMLLVRAWPEKSPQERIRA